jgi:TolA-binding protein
LLVAAAITVAGAAAGAGVRAIAGWSVPKPAIVAKGPEARVEGAVRGGVARPALPFQAPVPEIMSVATEKTTALPTPLPAGPGRSRPVRVAEAAPAPSSATGAGETVNPLPAPVATPDATTLFDRATHARRSGDHAEAARFYGELIERYPSAPEAHESYAVLGRMLLDDGDAEAALVCFERYLPIGVALEEDVMLGKALALRRLGRNDDELRAWSALLERYPGSVHTLRAKTRLIELRKR